MPKAPVALQFSCREGNSVDLRQADAVLRHRPTAIFWEAPGTGGAPRLVFDPNLPIGKNKAALEAFCKKLRVVAKKFRWVESDVAMLRNVFDLLKSGRAVSLYMVDGPSELLKETVVNGWNRLSKPRRRGSLFLWWVYVYLRERMMANNVRSLLAKNEGATVLVFMQKFHWLNVQFLLSDPSEKKIWDYYFGKFKRIGRNGAAEKIKEGNPVLFEYWQKYSDFAP